MKYALFFLILSCSLRGPVEQDDQYFDFKLRDYAQNTIRKEGLFSGPISSYSYPIIMNQSGPFYDRLMDVSSNPVGFKFHNNGVNLIVTKKLASKKYSRTYTVMAIENKKQEAYLEVEDKVGTGLSRYRRSRFYLFPRKYIPIVKDLYKVSQLLLANGESIYLFKNQSTLAERSVFNEQSITLNEDYPAVDYVGRGLVLRIDYHANQLVAQGSARVSYPQKALHCKLDAESLFNPLPMMSFKFVEDKDFFIEVVKNCPQFKSLLVKKN